MKRLKKFQRSLELSGCFNLRELGGYITSEGKQIKWQTLLRSDSLHNLPSSSQKQLRDYGVKTIIDLRSPFEIKKKGYIFDSKIKVKYCNFPLIEDSREFESIKHKQLIEHNYFFLDKRSLVIKTILETIANQQTAFLIHCAAGKDRTGLIIALLLAIAEVPVPTIIEDYQVSDRYLAPISAMMQQEATQQGFAHLLESAPQTMIDTFAYLDRHYGGVNNYLQTIGISLETLARLQSILVK